MRKAKKGECYWEQIYKSPVQFCDLCLASKHLANLDDVIVTASVSLSHTTNFGKRIWYAGLKVWNKRGCCGKLEEGKICLTYWPKKMKQNRFWGRRRLHYTSVSGTHIFGTIFKQWDNLGLSLQSCLGCVRSHAELRQKVRARASKTTGGVSLFVSYDNRQSSEGFNSNSLYGEAYHQVFMLQIKENIQILNGNNNFCRMKQT